MAGAKGHDIVSKRAVRLLTTKTALLIAGSGGRRMAKLMEWLVRKH
jgi:hypothetical protein